MKTTLSRRAVLALSAAPVLTAAGTGARTAGWQKVAAAQQIKLESV